MTTIYDFGAFELRTATRQLLVEGKPAPLGARAFDVLLALVERRDRIVGKNELLDLVWPGLVVEENNLQVQVSALRKVLGQDAIATIPGRGYRFTPALMDGAQGAPAMASPGKDSPAAVPLPKSVPPPIDGDVPSIAVLPSKGRGTNAEAFRLYLQGRSLVSRRTQASVATGIERLRQALSLDPGYALAWAALAHAQTIEAGTGGWKPFEEGYRDARKAAESALELEPDLAEAQIALSHIRQGYDWDWAGAEASMRRALELAPGNADVLLGAAAVSGNLGYLDESIALCRRAIALDPINTHGHRYLGLYSLFANLPEQAEASLNQALALNPFGGLNYSALGEVHLMQRRFPDAVAAFEKESHEGFRLKGLAMAHHALGHMSSSTAALEQLGELPMHAFLNAQANAYCGNVDEAFEWLERAYAQRNAGLGQLTVNTFLRELQRDPRWLPFLRKMGLSAQSE